MPALAAEATQKSAADRFKALPDSDAGIEPDGRECPK